MSELPYFQSAVKELSLLQTKWRSILNPVLGNPSIQSLILFNVPLANGTTVINHRLGRKLVGWRVIGINGAATVYDRQSDNQTPDVTLVLTSSASVTVNLEVF